MVVLEALLRGVLTAAGFFWDSLFGLIFGFLLSAIAQVALTPRDMSRFLGPNLRGVAFGSLFGIIASACSYGAAAASRGFYQRGADARAVFAFLISSTNMNLAIVILFWSMLGWRFAFAEFAGGAIIIAVVTVGLSLLFPGEKLGAMARAHALAVSGGANIVTECPLCGMEGEPNLAITYRATTYLACGRTHFAALAENPQRSEGLDLVRPSLRDSATWRRIVDTALGDVEMLWKELLIGYVIAGFAAALIPPAWIGSVLGAVGSVPAVGYVLLLVVGLLIAVITFLCSMGNVPVARFLAAAAIPLGANTTFIYGDLLIPPLLAIYRKSFPPRIVVAFVALFIAGAMIAGALMDLVIGHSYGAGSMGSMALSDRVTLVLNVLAVALSALLALIRLRPAEAQTQGHC